MTRELADSRRNAAPSSTVEPALRQLAATDAGWLTAYAAATAATSESASTPAASSGPTTDSAAAPRVGGSVTTEALTTYLRRTFPSAPRIAATEVIQIPGGRSKKTFFVTICGSDALPERAVIRQDYALK
jgi:hypothetical protein